MNNINTYEKFNESLFSKRTFDKDIKSLEGFMFRALDSKGPIGKNHKKNLIFMEMAVSVFKDLRKILLRYGKSFNQNELDRYVEIFKFALIHLIITRYGDYYKEYLENKVDLVNRSIMMLYYLKKYYKLNIDNSDNSLDTLEIYEIGNDSLGADSAFRLKEKREKLREKTKDIDPLGEENWLN